MWRKMCFFRHDWLVFICIFLLLPRFIFDYPPFPTHTFWIVFACHSHMYKIYFIANVLNITNILRFIKVVSSSIIVLLQWPWICSGQTYNLLLVFRLFVPKITGSSTRLIRPTFNVNSIKIIIHERSESLGWPWVLPVLKVTN